MNSATNTDFSLVVSKPMFEVLLAAHHGVFTVGPTLSVAFDHAYFVEIAAKIQLEWLKLPHEIRRTIPTKEAQLQRLANWSSVFPMETFKGVVFKPHPSCLNRSSFEPSRLYSI